MKLYDISHSISEDLAVWPGDSPFSRKWDAKLREGDNLNQSTLKFGAHVGTHADSFYHLNELTSKIDEMPLEIYLGLAQVITVKSESVQVADLKNVDFEVVKRVLFKTSSNSDPTIFNNDFTYISSDAAYHLVQNKVILAGIDTPSIDSYSSNLLETHKIFIRGKIAILEGLYLEEPTDGTYELMAFPLKIDGNDAAPVRAVLREIDMGAESQRKFVDDIRHIWEETFEDINF